MKLLWRKHIFPRLLKEGRHLSRIVGRYHFRSYSQEGEDMILRRIFENKKEGFYVDVGAYHPKLFSNTNFFYRMGWRGINIEPNPENFQLFQKHRVHDINLPVGVSDVPTDLTYYMFNEPALNTFEESVAKRPTRNEKRYYPIGTTAITAQRLDNILDNNLPENQVIDFLSIDVEGHELPVIRSNDWGKFRPRCLLVEVLESTLQDILRSELHRFMDKAGYSLYAKTANTIFYLDSNPCGK